MSNRMMITTLFLFIFISVATILLNAQDDEPEAGVKSHGVIQNISEDRQIERIGGIYQPEGLDKYMKRKFDALNEKIAELEAKVDQLSVELKKVSSLATAATQSNGVLKSSSS